MKIKRVILAMALTVPLVCGAAFGSLPGTDVMTVHAEGAGAGTESAPEGDGEAVTGTESPLEENGESLKLGWMGGPSGYYSKEINIAWGLNNPHFEGKPGTSYQLELYKDGQSVGTYLQKSKTDDKGMSTGLFYGESTTYASPLYICGWVVKDDGSLIQGVPGVLEEGIWTYRLREISEDGNSYGEWSAFSCGLDNRKESFLASLESSGSDSAASEPSEGDSDTDDSNDTVTTSSGEVLTSASTVYVNSVTPTVVRTSQGEVNAAVAGAVGGLKEGQSVAVTVGDSQCGELARQAVTNAAASVNGKIVSYLEITVDIYTPGEPSRTVAQLSSPIEFAVAAPEGIDGNQYDFAVIRLHGDGRVDILPDLDDDPATITFRTDRFSVYSVIYGPKGAFKSSGKDSVPKTGDSTVPALPFAAAGTMCAAAAVVLGKKKQA